MGYLYLFSALVIQRTIQPVESQKFELSRNDRFPKLSQPVSLDVQWADNSEVRIFAVITTVVIRAGAQVAGGG